MMQLFSLFIPFAASEKRMDDRKTCRCYTGRDGFLLSAALRTRLKSKAHAGSPISLEGCV
jgi:hypothetical protein